MRHKPRIYVEYVRHPLEQSRYMGVVAVVEKQPGRFKTGYSQCHADDLFVKKVGRDKAIGRAFGVGPGIDKNGDFLKPIPIILYNRDGTKYRIDMIGSVIRRLENQAKMELLDREGYTNEVIE